jgi:hypothetical protein
MTRAICISQIPSTHLAVFKSVWVVDYILRQIGVVRADNDTSEISYGAGGVLATDHSRSGFRSGFRSGLRSGHLRADTIYVIAFNFCSTYFTALCRLSP